MLSGAFIRAQSLDEAQASLKRFLDSELGNLVCLNVSHLGYDGGMAMIERLVAQRLYFLLNGNVAEFTPEKIEALRQVAGDYYLGVAVVTELSSLAYWDRDYLEILDRFVDWKAAKGRKMMGASDLVDARRRFLQTCDESIREHVTSRVGDTPNLIFDAGLYQNLLLDCGAAFPCLEMICGNPELMFAGARGAARAHGGNTWMSYIPECYLGTRDDLLRQKRMFLSYMTSYLAGAKVILRESGSLRDFGRVYEKAEEASMYAGYDDFDTYENADYQAFRDITAAFWRFAQKDDRPADGPSTPLAIVKGELDGYVGMWDRRVWGQFHTPEWEHSDIEREWDFFWQFYRRRDWSDCNHFGAEDISGNPPHGQVDIIPGEAPLDIWRKYPYLMFLGWNTMTDALYDKITQYVTDGGRIIMALSHCRSNIRRGEPLELFRNGDLSELFGVKVSGPSTRHIQGVRFIENLSWCTGLPVWQTYSPDLYSCDPECIDGPIQLAEFSHIDAEVIACASEGLGPTQKYPVIVEKKIGVGSAVLISSWSTPGTMPMRNLMHTLIQTIAAGAGGDVRFSGSDRLRYALYGQGDARRIYLLNTDYDTAQQCRLSIAGIAEKFLIEPCALQVVSFDGSSITAQRALSFTDIVKSQK